MAIRVSKFVIRFTMWTGPRRVFFLQSMGPDRTAEFFALNAPIYLRA
ncbi:hypothetical protein DSM3645_17165 [Blastopirellula marina DSM 3645]|uniref:Uncharacterized protein n=1 Tax=Blastopirellula marina DSM 3645 TaxID=314230 RepID=A3ZNK8_9BACT|nr:hypothetical protein DSM3645_17165 [Blastopirellula marina DSM 3645]